MKAIVLLFLRTSRTEISAMQLSIFSDVASSRNGGEPGVLEASPVQQLMPADATPPFWTWFIENPRANTVGA